MERIRPCRSGPTVCTQWCVEMVNVMGMARVVLGFTMLCDVISAVTDFMVRVLHSRSGKRRNTCDHQVRACSIGGSGVAMTKRNT
jgi:hypothetical protein